MTILVTYTDSILYDAGNDIAELIRSVSSKVEARTKISYHTSYIEVTCSGDFPWLFFSELDKAVRTWCAKNELPQVFGAVEMGSNRLLFNRHILCPRFWKLT